MSLSTRINKFHLRGRSIEARMTMMGNNENAAVYKAVIRDVVVSSGTVLISIIERWFTFLRVKRLTSPLSGNFSPKYIISLCTILFFPAIYVLPQLLTAGVSIKNKNRKQLFVNQCTTKSYP